MCFICLDSWSLGAFRDTSFYTSSRRTIPLLAKRLALVELNAIQEHQLNIGHRRYTEVQAAQQYRKRVRQKSDKRMPGKDIVKAWNNNNACRGPSHAQGACTDTRCRYATSSCSPFIAHFKSSCPSLIRRHYNEDDGDFSIYIFIPFA